MDSETETVRSQPTAPSPPPNGNGYMESIEKSPKATQLTESLPPQTHHQQSSELLASIPDPGEHVDRQSEHDFSVYESADEDPEPSDREDEEPISISIQIDGFPKSPVVDSPSTPHPYKQSRFDVERDETATPTPPPQPSTLSPNPGEDGELEVIGLSGTDTGSGNEGTPRPRKKRPKRRTPPPATVPPPRSILGGNSAIQDDGVYGFTLNNGSEYRRRIVMPHEKMRFQARKTSDWAFARCLGGEEDFLAAGQLLVNPGQLKGYTNVKDFTYVFYVIEGDVTAQIHSGSYALAKGSMFIVPPGNVYSVENTGADPARLFFAQARRTSTPFSPLNSSPTTLYYSFFDRLVNTPSSPIGVIVAIALQYIMQFFHHYKQKTVYWYKMNLSQYEPVIKKLWLAHQVNLMWFVLGYVVRRLPFKVVLVNRRRRAGHLTQ